MGSLVETLMQNLSTIAISFIMTVVVVILKRNVLNNKIKKDNGKNNGEAILCTMCLNDKKIGEQVGLFEKIITNIKEYVLSERNKYFQEKKDIEHNRRKEDKNENSYKLMFTLSFSLAAIHTREHLRALIERFRFDISDEHIADIFRKQVIHQTLDFLIYEFEDFKYSDLDFYENIINKSLRSYFKTSEFRDLVREFCLGTLRLEVDYSNDDNLQTLVKEGKLHPPYIRRIHIRNSSKNTNNESDNKVPTKSNTINFNINIDDD